MKKLVAALLLLVSTSASAQIIYDKMFGLAYDINVPKSNPDFIKNTSYRGGKFIYRQFINEHFTMGGDFSYATYNDYTPPAVYTTPSSSVYTDFYNYAYNYSIMLGGEYFWRTEKNIRPYAGFGFGAAYNQYALFYNIYSDKVSTWGVLLRPQAGVQLRFSEKSNWAAMAGLHYDYSSNKNKDYGYNGFTSLGLQIGLVYLDW
ncbi:MAG: outer membrane beta-barrel protein [Cyclobacteriaceae bacterium]|nr:outer membrane beta-barrel protein [Cyclobacteriaceae bacterium]